MLGVYHTRLRRAAAIDAIAHRAATSPQNDLREPTSAQKEAGNYKHGHVMVQGIRIAIENPAGSVRSGIDAEVRVWRTVMQHHYGRIKGTVGADDDQVDVFIGPHPDSELVVVIDQVDPRTGNFDEHKVILGAVSKSEACSIYRANYQAGWLGLGSATTLTMGEFKLWLAHHDTRAPIATARIRAGLPALQDLHGGDDLSGIRPEVARMFATADVDGDGRVVAKTNAGDVQNPGSRGGTFYIDDHGHIRYGTPAPHHRPFAQGAVSVRQVPQVSRGKSGLFAGRRIDTAADTAQIFRDVVDLDRERFWMVHMDERRRPLAVECISQGSLSASIVHPRETFKNAVQLGTSRVAFVHNHPSGPPGPSPEDLEITARLKRVGHMIGIGVDHHVVVGREGYADVDDPRSSYPPLPDAPAKRGRQLRTIEGRLRPEQPDVPWADVMNRPLRGSADVANVGRVLLDPGDRIALALTLDNKHRVIGVYPVAQGHVTSVDFVRTATRLAAGTSAGAMIVVASKDGEDWQRMVNDAHATAQRVTTDVGVRYLDTVSVGPAGSFRSFVDDGSLHWGRS